MSLFNVFNDPMLMRALLEPHAQASNTKAFAPNFDVQETPDAYLLEGELPGISDKKAINIEFTDHQTVVIAGKVERTYTNVPSPSETPAEEKKIIEEGNNSNEVEVKTEKAKKPKIWVSERSVGSFRRVFRFPTPVDAENVKASLEHGILSMVVPKMGIEKRRIEIQ